MLGLISDKKLHLEEGKDALRAALPLLERACDTACTPGDGCVGPDICTPIDCKTEANQIVDALVAAWGRNWGRGFGNDSAPDSHAVGGFLCFEWENIYRDAVAYLKPSCFSWKTGIAVAPVRRGRTPFHFYLKLNACRGTTSDSQVTVDDGFMFVGKAAHAGSFPGPGTGYEDIDPTKFWLEIELKFSNRMSYQDFRDSTDHMVRGNKW